MTHATGNSKAHAPVQITADLSLLTTDDRKVLDLLIEAAKLVDRIYLKQSNQSRPEEEVSVFRAEQPKDFYPIGLTAEMLEEYINKHPEAELALRHPTTVVTKRGNRLVPVPFSKHYRKEMQEVSALLRQAADLTQVKSFRHFLSLRSEAFLTNNYRDSDIAWIFTDGPLEVTIGPFEDYADSILGVKRTFEAVIGLVLEKETAIATTFKDSIQQFDAMLGERYGYKAETNLTPMVVIDEVYAGGEALYDYIPMAYNLPNDKDIHLEVGSKKVFIRNVMEAKFQVLTRPIAKKVLKSENFQEFDFDIYLQHVIGHEASHGLSFRFEGEDFGPVGSALEEAKADVFGMWFMYYLTEQGIIERSVADTAVLQNLTDGLRQVRFGATEAHGRGAMIQLNWFVSERAMKVSEYGLDFRVAHFEEAVKSLGDELYRLSQTRDSKQGDDFASEWSVVSTSVEQLLPRFAEIPIDIDPIFSF